MAAVSDDNVIADKAIDALREATDEVLRLRRLGDTIANAIDTHRENPTERTGHAIGIALFAWKEART